MRKTSKKIKILFIMGIILIISLSLGNRIYNTDERIMEESNLFNPNLSYWDPPITRSVGDSPISHYIGDADNDGYNDIVTSNYFDSTVSILSWDGVSGDWDPEITRSVGFGPFSVFIGDADNDGYNDIVTANFLGNTTSILSWDGVSGDWDPEITRSVGQLPHSIFIGDADNDGYNDIVTANFLGNTTSILLWNEISGDWDPQIIRSVGLGPIGIFIGDADNDGYNDIVTSNAYEDTISILIWNEISEDWDPQITKTVGQFPVDVFIGDANNDGYNDIATSNYDDDYVSILLWNPIFSTWDPQITRSVGYSPAGVFIEDANNDGYNDITAVLSDDQLVSILLWRPLSPIHIVSPENKTYTALTGGYYFATYGFENDINGRTPGWFQEVGTRGGSVKVVEELGGHKKILELRDTSSGFNAHVIKTLFATPEFGTIEYWMRSDYPKLCGFRLDNGLIVNEMITMRIAFNILQYQNGTGWNNIRIIQNNTWYHIRVDFECTTGNYTGLSQYTWRIYVNSINYGEFNFINNQNQASRIEWYTDYIFSLMGYSYYIDAIGFSWTNYNLGDNLNEGLLLSFDPKLQLDTISYSFDGQAEMNVLGNTVIPFPEDGLHTIQIFGSNSHGDTIQSELRYFTVDTKFPDIQINSPGLNDIFGMLPPKYNISIIEENVVSTWYTLDGGTTNISFTELTGYIDLDTWLLLENGPITIRFYVEDIVGNIDFDDVNITKMVEKKAVAEILPIPLIILITSLSLGAIVGTAVLLWFRKKRKD